MELPFTAEQYFNALRSYNLAIAPFQFLFHLLAATAIYLAFRKRPVPGWVTLCILSGLWVWMGAVWHLAFFSGINKVANLFGVAFIIQGLLLLRASRRSPAFRFHPDAFGIIGLVFLAYSLVLYPLFGSIAGHAYPASPRFGLPCPTTIFTFGILLWADGKCPLYLLIIPLLWSVLGFTAVLSLGMIEDTGLLVAGIVGTTMIMLHNRVSRGKTTAIHQVAY